MEKLWLKHYQEGVPAELSLDDPISLVAMFESACETFHDRTAYLNQGHSLSFRELEKLTRILAAYLQSLSLSPGARIAIMLPNCLQYPIALFAILRAGYIVVNTNPLYTSHEVAHQLKDSGAEAVIIFTPVAHVLQAALPSLPQLKHIILTNLGDCFSFFRRHIVNAVVKHVKKMIPDYDLPQAVTFREALSSGQSLVFHPHPLSQADIAFIQYTGGTTGISKGAILTHRNVLANVAQASAWMKPLSIGPEDIIITALPLYHIFSLTANCLTFLKAGAKNILITNPRDMNGFIRTMKQSRFTVITGVNTLFNALIHHKSFAIVDFTHLKLALAGGMALQQRVAEQWMEITKAPILEAYGLTETSPAVTINPLNLRLFNHSIGLPLPSTMVSIRDDEENELPLMTAGELCVKGPQVTPGYWQNPAETAHIFCKDGFLRTGDIAQIDKQGFIYLVDRKKEMILISGFNVYPNEIEKIISQMPGVLEVGVVGVKDEYGDEKVKACVVKRDQTLTASQIKSYCRQHLTAYKVPKLIEFHDSLPKTAIGKILKRSLEQ